MAGYCGYNTSVINATAKRMEDTMRTHKKTSNHVKTLCLLLGFGAIFSFASVYADPFTVTNYDSSGAGSLSTAINGLNLSGVSGSITFNESPQ